MFVSPFRFFFLCEEKTHLSFCSIGEVWFWGRFVGVIWGCAVVVDPLLGIEGSLVRRIV